jgi:hypothetical protein
MKTYPMSFWTGIPERSMTLAIDAICDKDYNGRPMPCTLDDEKIERILPRLAYDAPVWFAKEKAGIGARAPKFPKGSRVHHESWGEGTVTLVDGKRLEVDFANHGRLYVYLGELIRVSTGAQSRSERA